MTARNTLLRALAITLFMCPNPAPAAAAACTPPPTCIPDLSWSLDEAREATVCEIDNRLGRPDPCYFHTLAWQWFLHLMHPVQKNGERRNFEDRKRYFVLGIDRCQECYDKDLVGYSANQRQLSGWFFRTIKQETSDPEIKLFPFIEPRLDKKMHLSICNHGDAATDLQPGGATVLYDKFGKAVYYRVYYGKDLCAIYAQGGRYPGGQLLEVKTSWRQIADTEKSRFVHREADLPKIGKALVGLVGLHIAIDTTWNKRLVWATFEHKQNAPECDNVETDDGWSFTTTACARCLRVTSRSSCEQKGEPCDNINVGSVRAGTSSATITHVCRVHRFGGADEDNQQEIRELNNRLVGADGLLTKLPTTHPMAILSNYFHVGTLWLLPDTDAPEDQRGSLSLSNTTLETFQQDRNCLSCHKPAGSMNNYSGSHILPPGPASGR